MNQNNLYFNIHSFVKGISLNSTPAINKYFTSRFGLFLTSNPVTLTDADIILEPVTAEHLLVKQALSLKPAKEMLFLEFEEKPAIYFYFQNKIDYIIVFNDNTIRLFYLPSEKIYKRLNDSMVFCIRLILARKGGIICHGAVLAKENDCVWLVGMPMVKKTMLLLDLLSKGWDYISDDKFILMNNQAYLWKDNIALRGHHLQMFPALKAKLSKATYIVWRYRLMNYVLSFFYRFGIKRLTPLIEGLLIDKVYEINANQLFPNRKILTNAPLTKIYFLTLGYKVKVEKINLDEILEELISVQEAFFLNSFIPLTLSYPKLKVSYRTILADQLKGIICCRITAPAHIHFEEFKSQLMNYPTDDHDQLLNALKS
jgi:hypothetical protein